MYLYMYVDKRRCRAPDAINIYWSTFPISCTDFICYIKTLVLSQRDDSLQILRFGHEELCEYKHMLENVCLVSAYFCT